MDNRLKKYLYELQKCKRKGVDPGFLKMKYKITSDDIFNIREHYKKKDVRFPSTGFRKEDSRVQQMKKVDINQTIPNMGMFAPDHGKSCYEDAPLSQPGLLDTRDLLEWCDSEKAKEIENRKNIERSQYDKNGSSKYFNTSYYQPVPYMGQGTGIGDADFETAMMRGQAIKFDERTKDGVSLTSHYFDYIEEDIQNPDHIVMPFPRGGNNTRLSNKKITSKRDIF
jgi:hypothetical protein